MYQELSIYANSINSHVFAPEYPGYGLDFANSPPTGDQIDRMSRAVYDYLVDDVGIPPKCIILFGRSIGTGPAASLAVYAECDRNDELAGLVLLSGFTSVADIVKEFSTFGSYLIPNYWNTAENLKKLKTCALDRALERKKNLELILAALQVGQITADDIIWSSELDGTSPLPLLVIHGEKDDVVPISHSEKMIDIYSYSVDNDNHRIPEPFFPPPAMNTIVNPVGEHVNQPISHLHKEFNFESIEFPILNHLQSNNNTTTATTTNNNNNIDVSKLVRTSFSNYNSSQTNNINHMHSNILKTIDPHHFNKKTSTSHVDSINENISNSNPVSTFDKTSSLPTPSVRTSIPHIHSQSTVNPNSSHALIQSCEVEDNLFTHSSNSTDNKNNPNYIESNNDIAYCNNDNANNSSNSNACKNKMFLEDLYIYKVFSSQSGHNDYSVLSEVVRPLNHFLKKFIRGSSLHASRARSATYNTAISFHFPSISPCVAKIMEHLRSRSLLGSSTENLSQREYENDQFLSVGSKHNVQFSPDPLSRNPKNNKNSSCSPIFRSHPHNGIRLVLNLFNHPAEAVYDPLSHPELIASRGSSPEYLPSPSQLVRAPYCMHRELFRRRLDPAMASNIGGLKEVYHTFSVMQQLYLSEHRQVSRRRLLLQFAAWADPSARSSHHIAPVLLPGVPPIWIGYLPPLYTAPVNSQSLVNKTVTPPPSLPSHAFSMSVSGMRTNALLPSPAGDQDVKQIKSKSSFFVVEDPEKQQKQSHISNILRNSSTHQLRRISSAPFSRDSDDEDERVDKKFSKADNNHVLDASDSSSLFLTPSASPNPPTLLPAPLFSSPSSPSRSRPVSPPHASTVSAKSGSRQFQTPKDQLNYSPHLDLAFVNKFLEERTDLELIDLIGSSRNSLDSPPGPRKLQSSPKIVISQQQQSMMTWGRAAASSFPNANTLPNQNLPSLPSILRQRNDVVLGILTVNSPPLCGSHSTTVNPPPENQILTRLGQLLRLQLTCLGSQVTIPLRTPRDACWVDLLSPETALSLASGMPGFGFARSELMSPDAIPVFKTKSDGVFFINPNSIAATKKALGGGRDIGCANDDIKNSKSFMGSKWLEISINDMLRGKPNPTIYFSKSFAHTNSPRVISAAPLTCVSPPSNMLDSPLLNPKEYTSSSSSNLVKGRISSSKTEIANQNNSISMCGADLFVHEWDADELVSISPSFPSCELSSASKLHCATNSNPIISVPSRRLFGRENHYQQYNNNGNNSFTSNQKLIGMSFESFEDIGEAPFLWGVSERLIEIGAVGISTINLRNIIKQTGSNFGSAKGDVVQWLHGFGD